MSETTQCFHCGRAVEQTDAACRHCGQSGVAPDCPSCGKPVSETRSQRVCSSFYHGSYPWHHDWNGQCRACGREFVAELTLRTGHPASFCRSVAESLNDPPPGEPAVDAFSGVTKITIRRGDSVHMQCDLWDHQPTIEVRLRREVAANCGGPDEGLYAEDRIAMTPAEWAAVIAQLQGPLKTLMQREAWWEDTT